MLRRRVIHSQLGYITNNSFIYSLAGNIYSFLVRIYIHSFSVCFKCKDWQGMIWNMLEYKSTGSSRIKTKFPFVHSCVCTFLLNTKFPQIKRKLLIPQMFKIPIFLTWPSPNFLNPKNLGVFFDKYHCDALQFAAVNRGRTKTRS